MKRFLLMILLGSSLNMFAQDPEDGLRLSWFAPNGTARSNALGGAMGSLGGDLSSNHINPAGLGFYKSGELLLTPKFALQSNNLNYLDKQSSSTASRFNFGTIGAVFADGKRKNNWTSSAFSITYTQIADYNNRISFSGKNNFSSYSEKYLEELINDNADTLSALNNYIFGSSLAFRTYLVDTMADASGNVTGYQSLVPISTGVNQSYKSETSGGYNELAFGWGGNMADKLYLGASFVMPMINFNRTTTYSETDITNNANNYFGGFTVNDDFSSRGWGIGAKFGIIYKPESFLRVGFSLQTPQLISFRDQISADMTTNTESYAGLQSVYSSELNEATTDYYNNVNTTIKAAYKNNVNLKIGSELKLNNNWMARAGAAYYGSPYKDENIKASIFNLSGGIGYRTNKHFIDLTIVSTSSRDAIFPYRLNDKPNTYAAINGNRLMFNIGYGIRF